MKIEQIETNDRPREKMIEKGPEALSNIELLAIMLASGTKSEGVLDMSARLINDYGFDRLFNMSYYELREIKGIKDAKATRLMALFEIARRVKSLKKCGSGELKTSKDVFLYLKDHYTFLQTESLKVLYVNKLCEVIKLSSFTQEMVGECQIPLRKIVAEAINLKAFGIILSHNHPSGDLTPSESDIESTIAIRDLLRPIGIHLFDHLIISGDKFYSFSDEKTIYKYLNCKNF